MMGDAMGLDRGRGMLWGWAVARGGYRAGQQWGDAVGLDGSRGVLWGWTVIGGMLWGWVVAGS